jgi:hypothetical protein
MIHFHVERTEKETGKGAVPNPFYMKMAGE